MNITKGTLARTIILALALINQILSVCGIAVLPIEDGQIETLVSTAWTVAAAVAAWWKNNSFTSAAIAADQARRGAVWRLKAKPATLRITAER